MTPQRVLELIGEGVRHTGGTHTVDDVMRELQAGNLQLWTGRDCIGITEVIRFPQKIALNVFLAAGRMAEFIELQPGMEAFGRGRGATLFQFHGRATRAVAKRCGWAKSGQGFTPGWVMYTKEI